MIHLFGKEFLVFLIVLLYGFGCGFFVTITNFFVSLFKKNVILKNITDFINALVFGVLFFISINFHNFGEFRLYLLISFVLGFICEQKTINKPFAKLLNFGYNGIAKLLKKFKNSKCGKVLFK